MRFLKRLFHRSRSAPLRFSGGLVANLLGYHILRLLYFRVRYALRQPRLPTDERARAYAATLLEDGIVVIPNYFPEVVFKEIRDACARTPVRVHCERAPHVTVGIPSLPSAFMDDLIVNQVVSAVVRKDITVPPSVTVETTSFAKEDFNVSTQDERSDCLHFDVSYPTMKTLLYMNDVDEANGAFRYVRRSHRFTLARLWMGIS